MPARWYATGRIYFDFVLAYATGETVPDSVVEAYGFVALGAVSTVRPLESAYEFVIHPHVDHPVGGNTGGVSDQQVATAIASAIAAHETDPTPHSAYDDLPSLTILFENGLI